MDTEKGKRLAPTKKFKVKVVARPNTNKATAQPLQANTKAPINTESQRTLTPTPKNYPPSLEDVPAHASTPWPEAGRMSGNLVEIRKDWPIPPANDTVTATTPKALIKIEPRVPSATVSRLEQCGWGQNCPICKNVDENWDGDDNLQDQSQQTLK